MVAFEGSRQARNWQNLGVGVEMGRRSKNHEQLLSNIHVLIPETQNMGIGRALKIWLVFRRWWWAPSGWKFFSESVFWVRWRI